MDHRTYILDEHGHISNVIELECSNDAKPRRGLLNSLTSTTLRCGADAGLLEARRPGGSTLAISVRWISFMAYRLKPTQHCWPPNPSRLE